ncbi:TniQ family protein [Mesobacillus selenatarsenatis]|uniref:TniQ domain-containing protein n=1 Tax=Mesobacillus selenatarsenatis TaxID=388741 RepID=A0A846TCQ2_9BACI|nr:TniQ family protein [Mesobacillus selenatarsenatis]NKE04670.1 hypothetical protein [Mesobacillus selenatarsenatis]
MKMELDPLNRLTVRPSMKSGESLTSYLFRLCFYNRISLEGFMKLICKRRISKRDWFTIDMFPSEIIDLAKLSILSGCDIANLQTNLYSVVFGKIFDGTNQKKRSFKIDLNKLIVQDRRKFCIECLEQFDLFHLIWQVKDLNLCHIHKSPLVDSCQECGMVQPYFHERFAKKQCFNCHSNLFEQEVRLKSPVDEGLRLSETWLFFLDPKKPIVNSKFGLTNEQTIALSLLYAQSELTSLEILSRSVEDRLKALIRRSNRQRSILLSDLLIMSEKIGMTVQELLELEIDNSFVENLNNSNDKEEDFRVFCNTPWCKYKGSSKKMVKATSSFRKSKDKYTKIWACTSCYMRYGLKRDSKLWENVDDEINITSAVLKMLKENKSIREITKVGKAKTYQIIGYVLFNELLKTHNPVKYKIGKIPINDTRYFYRIFNNSMDFTKLYSKAKAMFGWNQYELGYYLSTPVVQEELYFTNNIRRKRYYQSKSLFQKKVGEVVSSRIKGENDISLLKIASSIRRNPSILRHYSLNEKLKKDIKTYKLKKKNAEFLLLRRKIESFFNLKETKMKKTLIIDVYSYLNVNRSYVRRNYLILDQLISQKLKSNNEEYKKNKYKKLAALANKAARSLMDNGERATIKKISMMMGISVATLYEHPEIMEAIISARRR